MAISMFSSSISPIAIDFGSASVKMLQVSWGVKPTIVGMAQFDLPASAQNDHAARMEHLASELPRMFRKGRFKGKRVCFSIPSAQTFVTHVAAPGGTAVDEYVAMHLHAQTNIPPANMVIRTVEVKDVFFEGAPHKETICFAVPRDVVMRHIELLKRCKMEVVGVHTEQHAIVWAFNHIHQRAGDERTTNLLVDFGWGGTKVGVSHGRDLVFSKSIHIGGRQFDQHIANTLECDLAAARQQRLECAAQVQPAERRAVAAVGAGTGGAGSDVNGTGGVAVGEDRRSGQLPSSLHATGPAAGSLAPEGVSFDELFEALVDELRMCVRYHRSLFEDRPISRAIFVGGEARSANLCEAVASSMNLPTVVGDPLARMDVDESIRKAVANSGQVRPEWTVACGLLSGGDHA